jgi:hypothetical protein
MGKAAEKSMKTAFIAVVVATPVAFVVKALTGQENTASMTP